MKMGCTLTLKISTCTLLIVTQHPIMRHELNKRKEMYFVSNFSWNIISTTLISNAEYTHQQTTNVTLGASMVFMKSTINKIFKIHSVY